MHNSSGALRSLRPSADYAREKSPKELNNHVSILTGRGGIPTKGVP